MGSCFSSGVTLEVFWGGDKSLPLKIRKKNKTRWILVSNDGQDQENIMVMIHPSLEFSTTLSIPRCERISKITNWRSRVSPIPQRPARTFRRAHNLSARLLQTTNSYSLFPSNFRIVWINNNNKNNNNSNNNNNMSTHHAELAALQVPQRRQLRDDDLERGKLTSESEIQFRPRRFPLHLSL